MDIKKSIGLSSLLLTSIIAHAGVNGTVFQDLPDNSTTINYGTQESNDLGLEGIKVTAYPGGESTTTAADGTWSLSTAGKVRVEFSNIPTHLKESPGQSSVQFLENNEVGNLALYNPANFVGDTNDIAMTFISNGKLNSGLVALKVLTSDVRSGEDTPPTTVGDIGVENLGSVWGLAYDSSKKVLYTSAVVRRYAAIGTEGTGAIYKIDITNPANPVTSLFTKVENTGNITENASRHLANDANGPSRDPIFDEVGRNGLGDLDISEDGTKLYTINLKTNTLIEIDLANPSSKKTYPINNPFSSCNDNDVKSWGIGQKNGEVYVGSVCTTDVAEGAYVSKLNGSNFTAIHQIPLNMTGESSTPPNYHPTPKGLANNARWRTWITDATTLFDSSVATRMSYPAPILSDIVFDEENGMILGFTDRTAMQAGINNFSPDANDNSNYKYDASGDIYRVCKVDGLYYNEGNQKCPQHDTASTNPNFPEFFIDEEWETAHREIALGGLAYQQGSSNIITTAFDPVPENNGGNNYDSAGLIWMNTVTGKRTDAQRMVGGADQRRAYHGKAGGMGDIEYLSNPAPTELGNRVWADNNGNCIQDANETGIDGVVINLYANTDCNGTAEQTTTTANNGHYLFTGITAGIDYSICIDDIPSQTVLNERNLTCASNGEGSNGTLNNNDATKQGDSAIIPVSSATNRAGANNHSYDFGFIKEGTVTTPIIPTPENNRTVNHEDGTCDCHSYTEDSTPAFNVWSMMIFISLTSFMAFLFRKELTQLD